MGNCNFVNTPKSQWQMNGKFRNLTMPVLKCQLLCAVPEIGQIESISPSLPKSALFCGHFQCQYFHLPKFHFLFFTDHDFFLFLLIFGYNLSLISHMPKLLNTQIISQIKVIFLSQAVTFLSWVSAVFSQATGLPAPFRRHPSREPTAICKIHKYEIRSPKCEK